ncbi:MAG: hypothetical protein KKH92_10730 [Firmicutes bacterium]|nr:hypothetical protein [Bacillota bacterium]
MTRNLKIVIVIVTLVALLTACTLTEKTDDYNNYNKIVKTTTDVTYDAYDGGVEDNNALLRFEGFEGIDTLFVFTGEESITITVYENVQVGKFKVVLVDPFNQVIELHQTTTLSCVEGQYRIKVVGEEATGTISINVSSQVSVSFYPVSK